MIKMKKTLFILSVMLLLSMVLRAVPTQSNIDQDVFANSHATIGNKAAIIPELDPKFDPRALIPSLHKIWLEQLRIRSYWSDEWQIQDKRESFYNQNNLIIRSLTSIYDYGDWQEYGSYDYTYNTDNLISEIIFSAYSGGIPSPNFRMAYTYTADNQILQIITSIMNQEVWHTNYRYDYEYDNGLLDQVLIYTYSDNTWNELSTSVYTYNAEGLITQLYTYYHVDDVNIDQYRYQYYYNPDGSRDYYTYQSMQNGLWINQERYSYTYNALGQCVIEMNEVYDLNIPTWMPSNRRLYTYDENACRTVDLYQLNNSGVWEDWSKEEFQYSSVGLQDETNPIPSLSLSCYPNPFVSSLHIDTKGKSGKVTIYNLKGQIVQTIENHKGEKLIWDGKDFTGKALSNALYLVRFDDGKMSKIRKVALLR